MLRPAWFLNLDADIEFACIGSYTRPRRVSEQLRRRSTLGYLLSQGDAVYGRDDLSSEHSVFCWSPTPSACRRLHELGLNAVRGPSLDVLRRANRRDWTEPLAPPELQRKLVTEADDWRFLLFETAAPTGVWRLKRLFGFAGRGQRRVTQAPSADDWRWIRESLAQGGLLREADVAVADEYSLHGYLDDSGLVLGRTVHFFTDSFGAPAGFQLASAVCDTKWASLLHAAAVDVAEQLRAFGYFGPFGVDAFTWRGVDGLQFNAVSDVNARFTLAWSLGMDTERDAALERYRAHA